MGIYFLVFEPSTGQERHVCPPKLAEPAWNQRRRPVYLQPIQLKPQTGRCGQEDKRPEDHSLELAAEGFDQASDQMWGQDEKLCFFQESLDQRRFK